MKRTIRALALIPILILEGQTPNSPPVPPPAATTADTSERVDARAAASANPFGSQSTSTSRRNYASVGVGLAENQRTTERKHEALAAVRLVDRNGDVIWTCTKESLGAKFQGSSVHVADQIVKQLLLDLVRK
ncbi:MAG: hypothetical protein MUC42_18455 [Bryobacter sp.]|nr:hypothetical protein [Bryobacter sp.]